MRHVLADDDCKGIEECTLMLSLSVFLVSCPADITLVPALLQQCTDIFTAAWQSKSHRVRQLGRVPAVRYYTRTFVETAMPSVVLRASQTLWTHALCLYCRFA